MRIALYQPDIPQNTGTILRLAACLGLPVDLILPAGFDVSDRNLRRAGLDYLKHVSLVRHESFSTFVATVAATTPIPRLILLTTKGTTRHIDFEFHPSDILLFGRESAGVPDSVFEQADARLRIPMQHGMRSINVAMSAALVIGEALRQTNGFPTPDG
jgi:tRNA (cytidine/uridine-2'-O-)-methyltransferase